MHHLPDIATDGGLVLTLGANQQVRLVSVTIGDPFADRPMFFTLTADAADEFADHMKQYAAYARGSGPRPGSMTSGPVTERRTGSTFRYESRQKDS